MSRRYVDRSLKKLYLEYEQQRPSHLKAGWVDEGVRSRHGSRTAAVNFNHPEES
ncbi:hypothetical protein HaLaN_22250, partial [Haematococcus lacustris]